MDFCFQTDKISAWKKKNTEKKAVKFSVNKYLFRVQSILWVQHNFTFPLPKDGGKADYSQKIRLPRTEALTASVAVFQLLVTGCFTQPDLKVIIVRQVVFFF